MKKFRIIFAAVACCILIGLAVYYFPVKRQVSMPVCTMDGEVGQVEMDLKYYRRLFSAPYVKGTLVFNGVEYLDEDSMTENFPGVVQHDADKWAWGLDFPLNLNFCKKSAADVIEAGRNRILFFDISTGSSFDKIHFMYNDDSMMQDGYISGISFFGPANNAEEAKAVAEYFGRPTD